MVTGAVRVIISGVQSDRIFASWHDCAPWLARAIASTKGNETEESVVAACKRTDYQLWRIMDGGEVAGAVVTKVRDNGIQKTVDVVLAGARSMRDFRAVESQLAAWAKHIGATKLACEASLGMAKLLPGDWKLAAVFAEKDIG